MPLSVAAGAGAGAWGGLEAAARWDCNQSPNLSLAAAAGTGAGAGACVGACAGAGVLRCSRFMRNRLRLLTVEDCLRCGVVKLNVPLLVAAAAVSKPFNGVDPTTVVPKGGAPRGVGVGDGKDSSSSSTDSDEAGDAWCVVVLDLPQGSGT